MSQAANLILVHLGPQPCGHLADCAAQAAAADPEALIWLIGSQQHLAGLAPALRQRIRWADPASLACSPRHRDFLRRSRLDRGHWGGFWRYSTERFFVIDEAMRSFGLDHAVHLENDNLLYSSMSALLPQLRRLYPGLGLTMDNDERCIPGLVFFGSAAAAADLAGFLAQEGREPGDNDMVLLARYFRRGQRQLADSLPVAPAGFGGPFKAPSGTPSAMPEIYTRNAEALQGVFDAAALGQYLGGIDPRLAAGKETRGFINESSVIDPSAFRFEWRDLPGLGKAPFLGQGEDWHRIHNLHVHSKDLRSLWSLG